MTSIVGKFSVPATRDELKKKADTDHRHEINETDGLENALEELHELISDATFYNRGLTSVDDPDEITRRGIWNVQLTSIPNRPDGAGIGILMHLPIGTAAFQVFFSWTTRRTYTRRQHTSGSWSEWETLARDSDVETAVTTAISEAFAPIIARGTPSGTKRVPLSVTAPGTVSTQQHQEGAVRWVRRWVQAPVRVRVHVMNRNPAQQSNGSAVSITGASLGVGHDDGTITKRIDLFTGATIPAAGGELVSDWISFPGTDGDALGLTIGWTGTDQQILQGGGWVKTTSTGWDDATTTGWAWSKTTPFYVWVEAEVAATAPVLLVNGDSISIGTATDNPVSDAWPAIYARQNGALPVFFSQHGSTMSYWSPTSARWGHLYPGMKVVPDAIVTCLGQNDLVSPDMTLATLQDRYREVREAIESRWPGVPVYAGAVTPSTKAASVEVVRREFNAWVSARPVGEAGYFDFSTAVGDEDDEALAPQYSADGLHPNTTGQRVLAGVLTANPPTHAVAPGGLVQRIGERIPADLALTRDTRVGTRVLAGDTLLYGDTGWRVISDASTNSDISAGRVLLRRVNGQITVRLDEVVFTKSGQVSLPRLPAEYHPQYRQRGVSFGLTSDFPTGSINISAAGYFNAYAVTAGEAVIAEATFPAKFSWPSAHVGTPL